VSCSSKLNRTDEHIEESVQLSITTPVSILAFRIIVIDYYFWKYD